MRNGLTCASIPFEGNRLRTGNPSPTQWFDPGPRTASTALVFVVVVIDLPPAHSCAFLKLNPASCQAFGEGRLKPPARRETDRRRRAPCHAHGCEKAPGWFFGLRA